MKTVLVIGAGPAGLTAAYELAKDKEYHVILIERRDGVGGIARTIAFEGNHVDVGPHHFYTTSKYIKDIWNSLLPEQGQPSKDDILLHRDVLLNEGGPDPEKSDDVLLVRQRISRILYDNKFFSYPLSFDFQTMLKLGMGKSVLFAVSLMKAKLFKRKERTMEDFLINNFGKALYQNFFRDYTIKAWGDLPQNISNECGTQRIQGISIIKALKSVIKSIFGVKAKPDESSGSINEVTKFKYPKYGAGQMWDRLGKRIAAYENVEIWLNSDAETITVENGKVTKVAIRKNGDLIKRPFDYVISSMPIADLFKRFSNKDSIEPSLYQSAIDLKCRNFVMIGIFVKKLKKENDTEYATVNNIIPDCWSYIYNGHVKISRINVFNNFSPYVVKNWQDEVLLGIEYICDETDAIWSADDETSARMAIAEAEYLGLIDGADVIRTVKVKEAHAYPAYLGTYRHFEQIKSYLLGFENLFSVGRKGQHRYLDMDQSMATSIECVNYIRKKSADKSGIWEAK